MAILHRAKERGVRTRGAATLQTEGNSRDRGRDVPRLPLPGRISLMTVRACPQASLVSNNIRMCVCMLQCPPTPAKLARPSGERKLTSPLIAVKKQCNQVVRFGKAAFSSYHATLTVGRRGFVAK